MAAAAILKNRKKSPYFTVRMTDLHEILYTDAVCRSWPFWNFENLKTQDGGGRHFEKSQNRHIPEMVWSNTAKLGKMTHIVILTMLTVEILKFCKPTMVAVAILTKKIENPLVWRIFISLYLYFT